MADLDLPSPPALDRTPERAPAAAAPAAAPESDGARRLAALGAALDAGGDGLSADLVGPARLALAEVRLSQSPDPVGSATDTIHGALTRELTDPVISRRDLDTIRDTFAALPRDQATAVAARLSDRELATWASDALGLPVPLVGGYERAERQHLYGVLAERLDAPQLRRVAGAFAAAGGTSEDRRIGLEIAAHAPERIRVDLVRAIALDVGSSNNDRFVAGEALASLRGHAFDRATDLPNARLRDVIGTTMEDALIPSAAPGGLPVVSYDAQTLGRVLDRVAQEGDARVRAVAFDAGGAWLAELGNGGSWLVPEVGTRVAAGTLREGLAGILEADPAGVVETLSRTVDRSGAALATTVSALVANGEEARVGAILGNVATGNGGMDSVSRFVQPDPTDASAYPNALTLGYAAGAVYAGIEDLGQGARERGETVKSVFGAAAGVGGAVSGPAAPVVGAAGTVLTPISGEIVDAVVDAERSRQREAGDRLAALTFPRGPNGDLASVPTNADVAFRAGVASTYVENHR